jgi:iron(III) transport system permease protein
LIKLIGDKIILKKSSKLTISSFFIVLLICLPIIIIFSQIFTQNSDIWIHLTNTVLKEYIFNTFYIMIGVGIITFILGFTTAYLTSLYNFSYSRFFNYALVLPFALPTYIVAFIYAGMFDMTGSITTFFLNIFNTNISNIDFFDIMSIEGAIIVMSLVLYPYVYLTVKLYLSFESSAVINASKSMGISSYKIFYKVILPICRPAIIAGISLAIMEAISDFGVVDYYGVSTFVTGIFRTWFGMGSIQDACKLASLLIIFIFLIIFLEKLQRRNIKYKSSGKDFIPIYKTKLKGYKNILAFIICIIPFFFGFILPFMQMSYWFILSYKDIIDDQFLYILLNTIFLASISAFIIVILALLLTYNLKRKHTKTTNILVQISKLGYSIPGAVIAIGVLVLFSYIDNILIDSIKFLFNININLLLTGSIIAMIFGYIVRFISICINNYESTFSNIPSSYYNASKSMGINEKNTFKKVFSPLIKNTSYIAFLMIFIEVIKELPLSMILRPFNYDTLAIRSYELTQQGQIVESAVPSMFIVIFSMISIIFLISKTKKAYDNGL